MSHARRLIRLVVFAVLVATPSLAISDDALWFAIDTVRAVGPKGAGAADAREAWKKLASVEAEQIPDVLEAIDEANPIAANYLRSAVDAACDRAIKNGEELPTAALERFVLDVKHAPKARRLAYERLIAVDPSAKERILPEMYDDPSLELRREAIEQFLAEQKDAMADDPVLAATSLQLALAAARDKDQIESLLSELKKQEVEIDEQKLFGYLVTWQVIGPFDNTDESGFDVPYPPEKAFDAKAAYDGKGGRVAWREYTTEHPRGLVDLNKVLGKQKDVVVYAVATFESPEARKAELRFESLNALKAWVNGREVAAINIYHGGSGFDQYVVPIELRQGANRLLVKCCQNNQPQSWAESWGFQVRLTDELGGPILGE